eukprot:TRINITY_DN2266_c0_g2_i1.p1 TRINITY_DN2266_c0_g2~~TRINITY_DN2266_c0_g2_i1.p1  ORF type:complete len:308 (+),score=40.81 TRINITY_DN2266_c0_g2_i1:397-1320(+)
MDTRLDFHLERVQTAINSFRITPNVETGDEVRKSGLAVARKAKALLDNGQLPQPTAEPTQPTEPTQPIEPAQPTQPTQPTLQTMRMRIEEALRDRDVIVTAKEILRRPENEKARLCIRIPKVCRMNALNRVISLTETDKDFFASRDINPARFFCKVINDFPRHKFDDRNEWDHILAIGLHCDYSFGNGMVAKFQRKLRELKGRFPPRITPLSRVDAGKSKENILMNFRMAAEELLINRFGSRDSYNDINDMGWDIIKFHTILRGTCHPDAYKVNEHCSLRYQTYFFNEGFMDQFFNIASGLPWELFV